MAINEAEEKTGVVTAHFFAKGYGFIEEEGDDNLAYFFHAHEARDFERLRIGDKVLFFAEDHEKGERAIRVRQLRPGAGADTR